MSLIHAFFDCVKNGETAVYILRLARIYDTELGEEKALRLDFNTDMKYKLAMAVILISGLHFIWRRSVRKRRSHPSTLSGQSLRQVSLYGGAPAPGKYKKLETLFPTQSQIVSSQWNLSALYNTNISI